MLSPEQFPYLAEKVGDDIITASGKTLLGADDKAGVAIVMAMARHLLEHPEIAHGPVRVCFTPDEEVGRGVHANLPADLKAGVAYTLDGGDLGEIVFETFSADKAVVTIEGVSAHPGEAKDVLVNALHLAAKIIMTLPHVTLTPETTEDRQGFIHVYQMSGGAAPRGAALHPARFRAGRSEATRGAPAAGLRDGPGDRATGADPLRDHSAIPQHAVLAGERHAPGRAGPARPPRNLGIEPISTPVAGRDGWIAPDRDGRADAEPVHRHAEPARAAGVDQRAGHGPRHRAADRVDTALGSGRLTKDLRS